MSVSVDQLRASEQPFHGQRMELVEPDPQEAEADRLFSLESGLRSVTSYPSQEQIIDEFNAYVRGPLRENIVSSLGREDHIPLKVCLVACLPSLATGLALTIGCDGHSDCHVAAENLGFHSVNWYQATDAILVLIRINWV